MPTLIESDLLDIVVGLLVIDTNVRIVGPADGSKARDGIDVGRWKCGSLSPAVVKGVFLDDVMIVQIIDANLGSIAAGLESNGSEGRSKSGLEDLFGTVPALARIGIQGSFVDTTVSVLMVDADMETGYARISISIHS